MILPPFHRHSHACHTNRDLLRKLFLDKMVRNPRLRYTYSHSDRARRTLVLCDPTRVKKGKVASTIAYRYCVKTLRSRTIFVFNIEWY
jgi:hypothetical protein